VICQNLLAQVVSKPGEIATFEQLAYQDTQPNFDLVHPGGMDSACNRTSPDGLGHAKTRRGFPSTEESRFCEFSLSVSAAI